MDNERIQKITKVLEQGCNPTYKTIEGMVKEIVSVLEKKVTISHTLYPIHPSTDRPDTLKYEMRFGEVLEKINKVEREGYTATGIELCFRVEENGHLYGLPVKYKIQIKN